MQSTINTKNLYKIGTNHTFKRYMIYCSIFLSLSIIEIRFVYWLLTEKPRNLITTNEYVTNNYELSQKIIER